MDEEGYLRLVNIIHQLGDYGLQSFHERGWLHARLSAVQSILLNNVLSSLVVPLKILTNQVDQFLSIDELLVCKLFDGRPFLVTRAQCLRWEADIVQELDG